MKKILAFVIALLLFCSTAQAALFLRGQGTSVHGSYNIIYDDHLDITWYDFSKSRDLWQDQVNWANGLSVSFNNIVYVDWRLPKTLDEPYVSGFDGTTTAGYNITTSEMGHLFYTELGGIGQKDTSGNIIPKGSFGLNNTSYFQNLLNSTPPVYWSETDIIDRPNSVWYFNFYSGIQESNGMIGSMLGLAVRDGDIAPNIIISPTPYDFGSIDMGNTSTPQTFTISNIGGTDLTIGTITLTGTDPTEFAIQNDYCSAQIIPLAGNCTIDSVFVPTLDGAKSASLSIPSDDPDTPTLDVPLSGTGVISFDIVNIIQDWEVIGNVTITWESVSGLEYQIASKDDYTGTFSVVDTVTGSAVSTSWTDDGTLTGLHPSAVQQRYYKVIRNSFDSGNIVGMYQIVVNEGMNLISLPLVPFSTALEDVIGVQVTGADNIGESDLIWVWEGTKYTLAWLVGGTGSSLDGKWYTGNDPTTVQFGADQGAWLQIRPGHGPVDIRFVGEVSGTNRIIQVVEGMNLIGTCYPVPVELSQSNLWESGFTGADNIGDSDMIWNWVYNHYDLIWLVDGVNNTLNGKWYIGNTPVIRNLEPGSGYWIQRREGQLPFNWDYINQ